MVTARIHLDEALPAAEALARGQSLLGSVGEQEPVLLYGAVLDGAAVALGAYQHAPQALRAEAFDALALPVLRRRTGGTAVWAAQGLLYFALGLADASTLMACPPGRILNRNVRGLLAGLRALGVPANYFGRDFVALGKAPGAYLGWDEASDGRVLLEAFVAFDTAFTPAMELSGYPTPEAPPLRGRQPTTLRAAGVAIAPAQALATIADGYVSAFHLEPVQRAPDASEQRRSSELRATLGVDLRDDGGLRWSQPREEAIGFVSAGVRLDARGCVSASRLAGDFYQHRACPAQLEARLLGAQPSLEAVGAALDAVYGARPGLIEGVRSLDTLRAAILDAVEVARTAS
ncbi:MAG: hypothetical protein ACHQ53_14035 [Polyangiales bacterium]